MATDAVRLQDLFDNPDPRVPVCLCLDTSGSMNSVTGGIPTGRTKVIDGKVYNIVQGGSKSRLQILQEGLQEFYDAVYNDENACYAAEICIVTFDDVARMLSDFSRVEYNGIQEKPPKLTANGQTAMGEGLNMALDKLQTRKNEYKNRGVDYYQPWLILITDGENNGPESELERAKKRIREMVNEQRLSIYPFHIGNAAGLAALEELSPVQKPMKIGADQMKGMFRWLGQSVAYLSRSDVGSFNNITLSEYETSDWNHDLD